VALFVDRRDAGRRLARRLSEQRYVDSVVLALPRGGVPVAFEVARSLRAPLDVFVVRKLGVPGHKELAFGAIASRGVRVLNDDIVETLEIPAAVIERVAREEGAELIRRERAYRGSRPPIEVAGHTALLVDDGLATGASMRAALGALRELDPARIVVAVPVAAPDTCVALREEADEVVCAETPEPFFGVGAWYVDFSQTSDEEVSALLAQAESRPVEERDSEPAHRNPSP
jgi:putative phosphoribosyl transferase